MTHCGDTSASLSNFSAIHMNAQPGNIINTPNADDGEILVFVADADNSDCNGAGQYLNFKPLVFDLRPTTGLKYVDMGVSNSTAGSGSSVSISWFNRLASSSVSYNDNYKQ